jgi:6-phosphogluconolactonase
VFDYDAATGTLRNAQDITTLPDGFRDFSIPADIQVHPSGRFLYASNRGHDSIAMYAVDDSTRQLRSIGFEPTRGEHPRNLAITPDGRLLLAANQDTDTIVAFAIDQATGTLRATGSVTSIPTPTCIAFLPEG